MTIPIAARRPFLAAALAFVLSAGIPPAQAPSAPACKTYDQLTASLRFAPGATELIDQKDLSRILVRTGHPGRTTRVIEYIVKGSGPMSITYGSLKGRKATATVTLR